MGDERDPLGLALEWTVAPPGVVTIFRPTERHQGRRGYLHGGMAATVLDETMAGLSWVLDRVATVTGTLNLRYRKPVPLDGRPLRVEAWREHSGIRRAQRVHGRLLLEDGEVAVEANGIFVVV